MKRKILMMVLSVLLVASMLIAPLSATAASKKTVQILQVTVDGARLRSGPGSAYDVKTSVSNGSKVFYLDALEHPERYDGKRIHARGRAFRMEDMPKNCYVFGRHVMTCCAEDIGGIGFLCQFSGQPPKTNDWIFVDAKVEKSFSPLHNTDAIILIEEKVSPAAPPKEELVYFN